MRDFCSLFSGTEMGVHWAEIGVQWPEMAVQLSPKTVFK